MQNFLAIVLIGGGSSWYEDADVDKAIKGAAKLVRRDWGHIYDMKKTKIRVNVFDLTGHGEWSATHEGVFGGDGSRLKHLKTVDG